MPDWSYQTLFKPALFRLPSRVARGFTLGAMGTVSRIPGGTFLIKTLGHMEPSPILESRISGVRAATPLGVSGSVDPSGYAHRAISRFGFGFVEVGPVTVRPRANEQPIRLERKTETIVYPDEYENPGLLKALRIVEDARDCLPWFIRVAAEPNSSLNHAANELKLLLEAFSLSKAAGFYVDFLSADRAGEENLELLQRVSELVREIPDLSGKPIYLYVPLGLPEPLLRLAASGLDPAVWSGCAAPASARPIASPRSGA